MLPTQVLGVICTTDITGDKQMFHDIAALKAILDTLPDSEAKWLTSVDLDGFTVVPLENLFMRFYVSLLQTLRHMPEDGRVIIVICGHSERDTGDVYVGPDQQGYWKSSVYSNEVGLAVKEVSCGLRPDQVLVVPLLCNGSSLWQRQLWTLLAADQDRRLLPTDHFEQISAILLQSDGRCTSAAHPVKPTPPPPPPTTPLDPATSHELEALCRRAVAFHIQNTGNAVATMTGALDMLKGRAERLCPQRQHQLLAELRGWTRDCARAERIAEEFGWTMTNPRRAEQWPLGNGSTEMAEAQAAGAKIRDEFRLDLARGRWSSSPGSWLAAAWRTAGKPLVEEEDWARAVAVSLGK
ncbi:Glycoside hydrolase family 76 protein [Mycena indigotica]|uniref:Glycoside hydrolase family 76 protein n=1 Tax=Mycena indigotica TaxID=2126181 RepID=A0A8H6VTD9_9AGAR|nr:Glycoside hydrolase family 76 protein [Mycena indigotica]KAF7289383.1 Glycoside hydrolase family 76 protein [Mycena indigotica]